MKKPVMHSIWLVLVLSVLSSSVSAGTLGDLTYEIADGQVAITDCDQAAEGELVISVQIEGLPVTSVGEQAFYLCSSLTSITIPEGVTSIGRYAFSNCNGLTSIIIPDNVTSIGQAAFIECSSLTSITIPQGVTSIQHHAFDGCRSLTSITIPNSVTSIGGRAFWDCSSLTSITIPDSVTSIGELAFYSLRNLPSITIPETFHSQSEANRLGIGHLWPGGFFLPDNSQKPPLGNPGQASANAILANGFVIEAEIAQEGAGYVEVPAVTISGGGGSGAEAVAVLTSGRVTSIEIINAGRGYTSAPTITIESPPEASTQVSLRLVPAITVTGITGQTETIEVADTADGPWTQWRTVIIGEEGTTEVDLEEGGGKRFYRVRD